jgi:TonB family protein
MNAIINYSIEANTGLLLFMILYWAILKNETQFQFKRLYLLVALLGSILFPLLHFGNFSTVAIPSIGQIIPEYWLPEVVINGGDKVTTKIVNDQLSSWAFAKYIYLWIALLLAIVLLYRIISISNLIVESATYRWRNYFVAETDEPKPTFSFFNFILIGNANQLGKEEKEEILLHESIHIQKLHSFDILLVNVIGIICWFNPIVRVYKKTLVQLHEFEADARSVENKDVDMYCGLLAKVALQSAEFPIANHFSNSLTIKRIQMLKTMKHKIQNWKVAALIATIPLFFIAVACQDQVAGINEIAKNSTAATNVPVEVKTELDKLQKENPNKNYILIEMNEAGEKKMDEMKFSNAETGKEFSSLRLIKTDKNSEGQGRSFVILEKGEQTNTLAEVTATADEVFTVAEEMATPKEGFEAFNKYVAENLKYPQQAREAKTQGKVFIQFTVNLDGTLSDLKVVKGISEQCDLEALRVVKAGPTWNPAKQRGRLVKQRLVIPFLFSLGNSDSNNKSNAGASE